MYEIEHVKDHVVNDQPWIPKPYDFLGPPSWARQGGDRGVKYCVFAKKFVSMVVNNFRFGVFNFFGAKITEQSKGYHWVPPGSALLVCLGRKEQRFLNYLLLKL